MEWNGKYQRVPHSKDKHRFRYMQAYLILLSFTDNCVFTSQKQEDHDGRLR